MVRTVAPVNAPLVILSVATDVTTLSENGSVLLSGSFVDADSADVHEITITGTTIHDQNIAALSLYWQECPSGSRNAATHQTAGPHFARSR